MRAVYRIVREIKTQTVVCHRSKGQIVVLVVSGLIKDGIIRQSVKGPKVFLEQDGFLVGQQEKNEISIENKEIDNM